MLCLVFVVFVNAQALRLAFDQPQSTDTTPKTYSSHAARSAENKSHLKLSSFAFRAAEREQQDLEDGVLAFVPGATPERVVNVKKTIAWLRAQEVPAECIIYKYREIFIPDELMFSCTVIDNAGGQWMDHIVSVPLNMTKKKYVLLINDGIEVQSVNLARMIKAILDNDLVHVAPALYGKWFIPEMIPRKGFGRRVPYIEYHMDLFTRANFACLQDLVASNDTIDGQGTTENHAGWFVDSAMTFLCPGGLGVIDAMKIFKFAGFTYNHTTAEAEGTKWIESHEGWPIWHELINHSEKTTPLIGDVLPTDPQCDGDLACTCPDRSTCIWN